MTEQDPSDERSGGDRSRSTGPKRRFSDGADERGARQAPDSVPDRPAADRQDRRPAAKDRRPPAARDRSPASRDRGRGAKERGPAAKGRSQGTPGRAGSDRGDRSGRSDERGAGGRSAAVRDRGRTTPRGSGTGPSARPPQRDPGPPVDTDVTGRELDREVREQLRTLSREAAETVARHLVMSTRLMEQDPRAAWQQAKAAVGRGGRLAVVREAAGVAAYRAGEYAEALAQLRAARRLSGAEDYLPIMADCERGLGRPERALALAAGPEARLLDPAGQVELRIVVAGARHDLGQLDAGLVTLQCAELRSAARTSSSARVKFAYADLLLAAGRTDEAREWFGRAARADVADETDACERLAELEGRDEPVWIDLDAEGSAQDR